MHPAVNPTSQQHTFPNTRHRFFQEPNSLLFPHALVGVFETSSGLFRLVDDGDLPEAIAASCAIPYIFQPVLAGNPPTLMAGARTEIPIQIPIQIFILILSLLYIQYYFMSKIYYCN